MSFILALFSIALTQLPLSFLVAVLAENLINVVLRFLATFRQSQIHVSYHLILLHPLLQLLASILQVGKK